MGGQGKLGLACSVHFLHLLSQLKAKPILSCIEGMKANSSLALPQPQLRGTLLQQQKGSISLRSV